MLLWMRAGLPPIEGLGRPQPGCSATSVVVGVGGFAVAAGAPAEPVGVGAAEGVAAEFSRARKDPSSAMVVINGAGNTTVVFLSTPISTRLCKLRSCRARG